MDIRPLSGATPGPQGLDALAASASASPDQEDADAATGTTPLQPAVKLDIGSGTDKARFIEDPSTSAIVFQVVDPDSGDVVEQLPSEAALRNRAYDSSRGSHGVQSGSVSRVA